MTATTVLAIFGCLTLVFSLAVIAGKDYVIRQQDATIAALHARLNERRQPT